MSEPDQARISRRALLAGSLASVVAGSVGCGRSGSPAPAGTDPGSVAALIGSTPFFIGSRGGSRDWPEMTAYGFAQAAEIPDIKAMELTVCRTADGVLVCSADTTTTRVTGRNHTILDETWATLSTLQVSARSTRDPSQPAQPLARFDAIATAFIDRFVLVVEPRVKEARGNLMAELIALGRPERIIYKEPLNSPRFEVAKQHGFSTWGYSLNEPAHTGRNLALLAASENVDLLGISTTQAKPLVAGVVDAAQQNQKPLIGWNVDDRAELGQAVKTGFTGIATTSIAQLAVRKP